MKKNPLTRAFALLLAAALTAALAAPATAAEASPTATGFSVSLVGRWEMTAGEKTTLSAAVAPEPGGADIPANSVEWRWTCKAQNILSLSDTDKAGVVLTAEAFGIATVTATATVEIDGASVSHEASCTVTVLPAPATFLTITPQFLTMDEEETRDLTASVSEYADPKDVTWVSSDSSVVQVSGECGQTTSVTAKAPGTATVIASSGDNAIATCSVEVRGVELTEKADSITVGQSVTFAAKPHGGIGARVEWESGNDSVAYVSPGGVVTGQAAGKTRITATIGGYSAVWEVAVLENTADVISDGVGAGRTFSFEDIGGDLNSRCRDKLGEALNYVTNLSVPTDQGILYYSYVSQEDPGHALGSSERYYYGSSGDRSLAGITFVPNSGFTGTAVIRYSGYGSGSKFFTGTIELDVAGGTAVAYTTTPSAPITFLASDFTAVCRERTGRELDYVTFDLPSASRGTLYYDYSAPEQYSETVSGATRFYRTHSSYLDRVSFVPNEDYTGTFRIGYRCVDTSGSAFSGQVTITVTRGGGTGGGDVNYSVDQDGRVTFRATDFNSACRAANGESLNYVAFTLPPAGKGTLYYNYRNSYSGGKVSSGTRYYRSGSPSISNITFVPDRGFAGTVSIDFSGYDDAGDRFSGQVSIRVSEDGADYGEVRYETDRDEPVAFQASDFNDVCLDVNGARLNYIRFVDLPSGSEGTLYYNYRDSGSYDRKVSTGTWYYRSGTPAISNITFVPKSTFEGTVTLAIKGYDVDGASFGGSVRIDVGGDSRAPLRYSVVSGNALALDADDFNAVCRDETDKLLNYVQFTLPPSSRGVLYYRYDEDKETNSSKVSASTRYYRSGGTRLLKDVSFVPAEGYTGPVAIAFSGWSTAGKKFTGTVEIEVTTQTAAVIRYTGSAAPIRLRASDFQAASTAIQRRDLSCVQFSSLPGAAAGQLYVNYTSPGQRGAQADTGVSYYSSGSPGLDQLSFVPKAEFQGQTVIQYVGVDTKGRQFSGVIEITVANAYCVTPFIDMGNYEWAKPSAEFLRQGGVVNGFTAQRFGPGDHITRGDFALMLCRAFQFRSESKAGFPDVDPNSYYGWAVATAKELGIVQGAGNGNYFPGNPLTRQEAMVMIWRAMKSAGLYTPIGTASDLSAFKDGGQVSDFARDAVASMVQMGIVAGSSGGRINPKSAISRAEMAVMLHRVLTQS